MGGRLAPEWVDGINRNGWTASPGIAGRNHAEYASRVPARSLLCFWATRGLGISMAQLSRRTRNSQSSISMSVRRAEQIAEKEWHSWLTLLIELKL